MAYPGMDNGMNAGKAPLLTPQTSAVPYAPAQQGMNANQQAIPVAQTVAGTMPSAPPLAQIQDFTGTAANVPAGEEAHTGGPPGDTGRCALGAHAGAPARYWSPEEMKTLQAQAVPVDPFRPARGQEPSGQIPTAQAFAAAPVPVATATAVPVLTTTTGVPVMVNVPSSCVAEYDGYTGVKSCDPRLNTSIEEVMRFLQTYNTRPRVAARCHGYHRERRTRQVREQDDDGGVHYRTETYYVTVTDFDYRVDLSQFVFPFGFIQSVDPNGRQIPDIIRDYHQDPSKLKTLKMYKEIGFDFRALGGMIHGYIRQLGWWRGLSVTFPRANYRVKIWSSNWLSDIWESCFGKCLCYMSIIGCCIMNCVAKGHKQDAIRSFYQINYHPLQVFAMIQGQLWCPGFSGARMAAELLRDVFW